MSQIDSQPPPVIERPRVAVGRLIIFIIDGVFLAWIIAGHVFLVPKFRSIFAEQGAGLPWSTQFLLSLQGWPCVIVCWAIFILLVVLETYSRREHLKRVVNLLFLLLLLLYSIFALLALFLPMINMIQVMQEGPNR